MEKEKGKKKKRSHSSRSKQKDNDETICSAASSTSTVPSSNTPLPPEVQSTSSNTASLSISSQCTNTSSSSTPPLVTNTDESAIAMDQSDARPSSPEPDCAICLSKLENKSFTDSCFHMFCFVCLMEWSKVKAECPLCKQPFKSIVHNVRSLDDYDQYHIPRPEDRNPRSVFTDFLMPHGVRFRYRWVWSVNQLKGFNSYFDVKYIKKI